MLDSRPMSVRHITNPFIPACNINNHLQPSLTQTAILPAHPHISASFSTPLLPVTHTFLTEPGHSCPNLAFPTPIYIHMKHGRQLVWLIPLAGKLFSLLPPQPSDETRTGPRSGQSDSSYFSGCEIALLRLSCLALGFH